MDTHRKANIMKVINARISACRFLDRYADIGISLGWGLSAGLMVFAVLTFLTAVCRG